MVNKNNQIIAKKPISIVLIVSIILALINLILPIFSHAEQTRNIDENNINNINETLYPGYADALKALKASHSNWTFTLLYTNLEWSDVLMNETTANHARSLVQGKTGEWLCKYEECDGIPHDGTTWFGASEVAVAYFLDPRNFLTEDKIFQFETLSYIPSIHTALGVEAILNGTFMSNKKISEYYGNAEYGEKTFAEAIMSAAVESGVSPYHIASRIRQEIGVNGSGSSNGKVNGYEGYFNFYNIGATASGDPVINGLKYAVSKGWNTPEISIIEGAKWLSANYISKGQDSLYLQKFDVDDQFLGLYWHIYQTNIQAPNSESSTIYNSYKKIFSNDLTNTSFNFIIPMYKHIPKTISRYPSNSTYTAQNAKIVDNLGIGVYVRQKPAGKPIGLYYNGEPVIRMELNAANISGNTWDKIMLKDGTIGYIAKQYLADNLEIAELSKEGYINADTQLLNGPRTVENGSMAYKELKNWQIVTILEQGKYTFDGYVWDKVKLKDGSLGYVPHNFVKDGTYGEKVEITCNTELALRETPTGTVIKYLNPGVIVTRVEEAYIKIDGKYYWDKVITDEGTIGYMARERYNPYVLWLTPLSEIPIEDPPTPPPTSDPIDKPVDTEGLFEVNKELKAIKLIPKTTFAKLQEKYNETKLVSGTQNLETGSKISINNIEYTIIRLGDVNGDAQVDVVDLALLKRHLSGTTSLQNEFENAGILQNGNTQIDIVDLALLKRHLSSTQFISIE